MTLIQDRRAQRAAHAVREAVGDELIGLGTLGKTDVFGVDHEATLLGVSGEKERALKLSSLTNGADVGQSWNFDSGHSVNSGGSWNRVGQWGYDCDYSGYPISLAAGAVAAGYSIEAKYEITPGVFVTEFHIRVRRREGDGWPDGTTERRFFSVVAHHATGDIVAGIKGAFQVNDSTGLIPVINALDGGEVQIPQALIVGNGSTGPLVVNAAARPAGAAAVQAYVAGQQTVSGALSIGDTNDPLHTLQVNGSATFRSSESGGVSQDGILITQQTTGEWRAGFLAATAVLRFGAGTGGTPENANGTLSVQNTGYGILTGNPVKLQNGATVLFEGNATGFAFSGKTPIAPPDYTVTNAAVNRSLDVSAATLEQLREIVGTMIQDAVDRGLYQ